ncbi:uncharacterized protein LOC126849199 [Cataglyphis hispanica]|uniref:uncharacterized protein LOC126849199 n=1 Tax=Cataglyphis hispanica TaxID=1086592 RepID=UPI00217F9324|nr:uncharacterized protein LOC126849199 [Cataglyphis hispanica]
MSTYEENLQKRREKLRDLILSEEMNLTREIEEEARRGEDARLEEMRARTEELRKRHEEEHEAVVAAKRMQQYLLAYPDIKQKLWKERAIDAKLCNVAQMADNETRRSAEKELDDLWHQLMMKELEAKKSEEAEKCKKRALANRETALVLTKQAEDKLMLEEGTKRAEQDERREHLKRLWEEVRQAELQNLEAEKQKRERLKRELEEQILTTKRFLVERARKEAMIDCEFNSLVEDDLAREKASAQRDTAALRKELLAYLKYVEDLRQEEIKRNLEVEAIIEQSHKDIQARRNLAMKKFKETRYRILQETLCGRKEQLRAKQEMEEQERRFKMEEKEAVERQIEMNANLIAMERKESRQRALCYGLELKEQQRYVEEKRRRELEEDRRYHREEAARQADEYQKLTDELLKTSENITPHPFKILLKECAARHAAEREGRHYCPPALTSA